MENTQDRAIIGNQEPSFMIFRKLCRLRTMVRRLLGGRRSGDDFDWNAYPRHYRDQQNAGRPAPTRD